MKRNILAIALPLLLMGIATNLQAQEDRNHSIIWSATHGLEYEVKAGINIGGTAPLPLPKEIRSINSYSPNTCFAIEGNVIKWLDKKEKWGIILGLRVETKGMETKARVKNYGMEIIGITQNPDGSTDYRKTKGNWTGMVQTKYSGSFFSIPLLAAYKVSQRVRLQAGPYFSFATSNTFDGYVYEGYLRENGPTGNKVQFKGDSTAPYDFSDDLRKFQWGIQAGVNWRAFKHLTVSGDLTWGLNDIFKKDFKTITFPMYPIYLNIGFGYAF
nr:porin family protein [uncultured Bacteroides sp.]